MVGVIMVLVACTGSSTPPTAGAGLDSAIDAAPADGAYHELLAMMPDTPEIRRSLTITDVASARAVLGLVAPPTDAGLPERFSEFPQLFGQADTGVSVSPSGRVGVATGTDDIATWATEFGYSFVDVDQEIYSDSAPGTASIVQGRFTDERILDAARTDPAWSPDLDERTYGDGLILAWGDDGFRDPTRVTSARPNGEGGRLVPLDGAVAWSLEQATAEAVIDAAAGVVPSLDDNADIAGLVDAVTESGTYEVFVSAAALPTPAEAAAADLFEPDTGNEGPREAADNPVLVPPAAMAITKTLGPDGEIRAALGLAHRDEGDAETNAERLRAIFETGRSWYEPVEWSTFFDVRDITTTGRFTVIRVESGDPGLLRVIWEQRDSLFAVSADDG